MTIASEITRLQGAKADIKTAIENKGVTVGNVTLDSYASCIDAIPTGADVAVVDFLLIGGGGGGGRVCTTYGGGGGAGGVIVGRNYALSKGSYNVTIGSKGTNSGNGGSSCFEGYVALGGGGGGTGCRTNCAGKDGASGGGAGGRISTVGKAQQCLYVQGYNGGAGNTNGHGGGGGGFGGAGCCCSSGSGGDGGIGYLTSMTGHEECFAGGGGGANNGHGMYGGGNSQGNASTCGSGGGGSCNSNSYNGGGGALIIAYPSDCGYNISGANCSCVCNGVCVHCFTSSGTLTVN